MDNEAFLVKQNKLISLCPEVNDILYALNKYLDVTFFRYVKSYPNGEKFILSNSEPWLKEYFKSEFYNREFADYSKHPEGSKGVHIHHECDKEHPVCQFWNKNGKIGKYNSKIAFFIKFKAYFEMYDFGILGDSHRSSDTFFNNQKVFRHFFLYFKSRGRNLFKEAELAKFSVNIIENYDSKENWLLGINEQDAKLVFLEMPLLEFYLDDEFADVALTLEEARSLRFLLMVIPSIKP
ncbi:MAG: hypothetical protein AB7I18_03205 [Candidatus Berkiella sp.]